MPEHKKTPGGLLGGLSPEGSDEAGKLPARIERYSKARDRALQMVAHLASEPHHEIEHAALLSCGDYLLFHHYFTVDKVRLAAMQSCKRHLLCPLCAIRRGAKTLKAYLDRFTVLQAQRSSLRPYLVTFTVRNGEDLEERFKHLSGALRRLHGRRREWIAGNKRAPWTEAARADGAVWSYELTNIGNGWHPHAHAIWLCEEEPNQQALRDEWERITGDSFMVDVCPIGQEDPAEGFCEVFKYALKFSDLSLADNV